MLKDFISNTLVHIVSFDQSEIKLLSKDYGVEIYPSSVEISLLYPYVTWINILFCLYKFMNSFYYH